MIRTALRAGLLLALGPVAARLGIAMLPTEAVAGDQAHRGEMVRDLEDLADELAAAHQAAGIWKAAAKGYRADLARLGVEMSVTCGDEDEERGAEA